MTSANIEFVDLKSQYKLLKEKINSNIQRVFEHGQYILGPEVYELEHKLSEYTGAKYCITVSSGTSALLISLLALKIQPGDEVITTSFTFAATAEVIMLLGATPVFIDIDHKSYHINANLIESAITSKTRAIIPVSMFGQVADMDEINAIAKRNPKLIIIEDAAQSFGATYKGRKSCNLSLIGCTSFFPSKPLGCYGNGGAIFTNSKKLAQIMRELRNHGQKSRYYHTKIGINGCMDTIQSAILLAKLENFDCEIAQRQKISSRYFKLLSNTSDIILPEIQNYRTSVWAQFTIRIKKRDVIRKKLQQLNIPTAIHYPRSLHNQPAYRNRCRYGDLKHSISATKTVLSLPISAYLTEDDQMQIITLLS